MSKFNFKNEEDFSKVKEEIEKFYHSIKEIRCPYFEENIIFNAKWLRHLKFKSDQKARTNKEQYTRLKLLKLAPEVLKKSHTIQGKWETKKFEEQKTNKRWEKILKEVIFYEFIAIMENIRVKVILKEVHGGVKYFWSVIPFWNIDKNSGRRVLSSGDPDPS